MAGLGAALGQIYIFKPVIIVVSPVFLLLLNFALGKAWENVVYVPLSWLESRWVVKRWTAKTLRILNPGPFGLKEVSNPAAYYKLTNRRQWTAHCSNSCSHYCSLRINGSK
jgi:hypothetical protein